MAEDKIKLNISLDIEEMARAGLHFGHRTSKIHPKMKPYLYGTRSTVHIIDLDQTKEKLTEALEFIGELVSQNKILLLVGTKIQIKELVRDTAQECGLFYVSERWLGGTITNFGSIFKRIEHYRDLEKKKAAGELEKYTKKEKLKFDEELTELERKFGGIKELNRVPDATFICDMEKDFLAAKEARAKGVKVIGICDTNIDPTLVDYPIPASDDAASSVKYILDRVKEVVLKVKS